jgi:hypothetical protein
MGVCVWQTVTLGYIECTASVNAPMIAIAGELCTRVFKVQTSISRFKVASDTACGSMFTLKGMLRSS